jgi:hypothetical protein
MTLTFDNHCALFADIQARRFRWHMTTNGTEENKLPVGSILVTDNFESQIRLIPDALGSTRLIAVNTDKSNLEFDALKFETTDSTIKITLSGK